MEQRTLELELVSARDVKHVNLISKMSIYAAVSISGDPYVKNPMQNKTKTNLVRKCGTNPSFNNFPIRFTFDDSLLQTNRLSLHVSLLSKRTLLADTPVGSLHLSLKDLLESSSKSHDPNSSGAMQAMQIASYQLRRPSGRPHGELSFRYKFGEKVTVEIPEVVKKSTEPVTAYPVGAAAPYAKDSTSSSAYPAPYPPVQPGYEYPVAQPGYAYPPVTAPGYGYVAPVKPPKKKNNNLGMGLAAGFIGGIILGDAIGGGCGGGGCGGGGCGGGGCGGGCGG